MRLPTQFSVEGEEAHPVILYIKNKKKYDCDIEFESFNEINDKVNEYYKEQNL